MQRVDDLRSLHRQIGGGVGEDARQSLSLAGIRKTLRPPLEAIEHRREGALCVCLATAELEALQPSALAGSVLEDEPRFSNPGFPADLHQDRPARRRARLCVYEQAELVPAAHERREPSRSLCVNPCLESSWTRQGIHPHEVAQPAQRTGTEIDEIEVLAGAARGLLTDQDLARCRRLLKASCQSHGGSLRRVVHPEICPDGAYPDGARVYADAERNGEPEPRLDPRAVRSRACADLESGTQRPDRIIPPGAWCTEESHESIASELVERAALGMNGFDRHCKEAVHDAVHVLGIERVGHLERTCDIRDEDCHLLAFTLEGRLRFEDLARQVGGRIGTQAEAWAGGLLREIARCAAGQAKSASLRQVRFAALRTDLAHPSAHLLSTYGALGFCTAMRTAYVGMFEFSVGIHVMRYAFIRASDGTGGLIVVAVA